MISINIIMIGIMICFGIFLFIKLLKKSVISNKLFKLNYLKMFILLTSDIIILFLIFDYIYLQKSNAQNISTIVLTGSYILCAIIFPEINLKGKSINYVKGFFLNLVSVIMAIFCFNLLISLSSFFSSIVAVIMSIVLFIAYEWYIFVSG